MGQKWGFSTDFPIFRPFFAHLKFSLVGPKSVFQPFFPSSGQRPEMGPYQPNGIAKIGAKGSLHWRNMGLHGRKPCLHRRK